MIKIYSGVYGGYVRNRKYELKRIDINGYKFNPSVFDNINIDNVKKDVINGMSAVNLVKKYNFSKRLSQKIRRAFLI